jgi:hypothetical protein
MVPASMPKRSPRKDSDYIRFRPYHAFASAPADESRNKSRKIIWWAVLIIGAAFAVLVGAVLMMS